ncbi:MAG: methionyl-tRNA formyltransferase [Acidobacteriota bacterium]
MTAIERIVFFGTPAFAVPTLQALVAAGRSPTLVVSQPARGRGRGRRVVQPPVAHYALDQGLELAQPDKVREAEFLDHLRALEPDLAVVVAFGQIFSQKLLDIPRLGCVNVHASLLPAYRGAAPIAAAIRSGDERTGVTTMVMERGLDSGPMLLEESTEIGLRETCGELTERLSVLGAQLLVQTVDALEAGTLEPREQDHDLATFAPQLKKSDGAIDFRKEARLVDAHLRGFDPWPGSFATFRGEILSVRSGRSLPKRQPGNARPGEILGLEGDALAVACGASTVFGLESVQRPGKKPVSARDWVNGSRPEPGEGFTLLERAEEDGPAEATK